MQHSDWSSPVSSAEAARRAGGRAHYNSMRALFALCRRLRVLELIPRFGTFGGGQSKIAAALGVSRATICRDIAALMAVGRCPSCGRPYPRLVTDGFGLAAEVENLTRPLA